MPRPKLRLCDDNNVLNICGPTSDEVTRGHIKLHKNGLLDFYPLPDIVREIE